MKKFILAALLALPLSILAQERAAADGCACCFSTPPIGMTIGFRFKLSGGLLLKGAPPCGACCGCGPCCGGCGGGGGGGGGPWYSYWPQDAHFQTPAPTGYPYWPSAMSPMMNGACYNYGAPQAQMAYGYGAPQGPMGYGAPSQGMVAGYNYGPPAPPMALPMAPSMNYNTGSSVQPCGYTPSQAPSYWYGR